MNSPPLSSLGQSLDQQKPEEGSAQGGIVSSEQLRGQGAWKGGAARVTAADVISSPSLPRLSLQTFEELEIPAPFRAKVEMELTEGEKIVWLGRPSRNRQVHPRNTALLIAGIGMASFGLLVAVVSLGAGGGAFPVVFGGALTIIGGAFMLPLVVDPTKNCRSCYVVTNRRAMIVENSLWARGASARSYLPHELIGLERRSHAEVAGAGDVIFEYTFVLPGKTFDPQTGTALVKGAGMGRSDTPTRVPRGFLLIDQAAEVENLIRSTLLGQLENTLDAAQPAPAPRPAPQPAAAAVSVACACGLTVEAPESLAGQSVKCPQCSAAVAIPAPQTAPCREEGSIPADLRAKILMDLAAGERVVWVGQPVPNLVFLRNSGWLALGGIGLLCTLIWFVAKLLPAKAAAPAAAQQAVQQAGKKGAAPRYQAPPKVEPAPAKASGGSYLLGLAFLILWGSIAAIPFIYRYIASRTCYALTNRRALVYKQGIFSPTHESYPPLEVANMRQSNSWLFSGCGDLIFRTVTVITTSRNPRGGSSSSVRRVHYGFLAIPQVQQVGRLVRETLIDPVAEKLARAAYLG
jgi:hypothetical protein